MKIVRKKYRDYLVQEKFKQYGDCLVEMEGYRDFLRKSHIASQLPFGLIIIPIIQMTFANVLENDNWQLIILAILARICLIIILYLVLSVFHEFIHYLFLFGNKTKKFIIIGGSGIEVASVYYDDFITKSHDLIVTISPFAVYCIVCLLMFLFNVNTLFIYWVLYLNLAMSNVDIINFVYTIIKVPRNSVVYGNYIYSEQITIGRA